MCVVCVKSNMDIASLENNVTRFTLLIFVRCMKVAMSNTVTKCIMWFAFISENMECTNFEYTVVIDMWHKKKWTKKIMSMHWEEKCNTCGKKVEELSIKLGKVTISNDTLKDSDIHVEKAEEKNPEIVATGNFLLDTSFRTLFREKKVN